MKRFLSSIFICIMILCLIPCNCLAAEAPSAGKIISVFEDGSYLTEMIISENSRAGGSKNGSKTYEYYSVDGRCLWNVTLSGSFTYSGSTSSCTAASVSTTIYDSAWYTASKDASRSGNTAYGSATMGRKALGVTVQTVPVSLTLTCDADGNLS